MDALGSLGINLPGLITQLVSFVILFAVLYKLLYKPVLRMLDQRSDRIKESLETAERVRQEAADSQEQMRKQLETARAGFDAAKALHKRATEVKKNQELVQRILDAARMRLADAQRKLCALSE